MFIDKRTNGKLEEDYDEKRVAFTLGHAGVSQKRYYMRGEAEWKC